MECRVLFGLLVLCYAVGVYFDWWYRLSAGRNADIQPCTCRICQLRGCQYFRQYARLDNPLHDRRVHPDDILGYVLGPGSHYRHDYPKGHGYGVRL